MKSKDNINWIEMEQNSPLEFKILTYIQYGCAKWEDLFISDLGYDNFDKLIFKLWIPFHKYARYANVSYEHLHRTMSMGVEQYKNALTNNEHSTGYLDASDSHLRLAKEYNAISEDEMIKVIVDYLKNPHQL